MTSRTPESKPKRRRLSSEDRRQDILDKAIVIFAERGLSGSTRDLARELGVTQPLLYRYFPSKRALVEEVYETVFLQRWNPDWEEALSDRTRPLRDRLLGFYASYTETVFQPDWMRIYFHSGLAGDEINRTYVARVEKRLLNRIVAEFKAEHGQPETAPTMGEVEMVWIMHAGIFYHGVRKVVFEASVHPDKSVVIRNAVDIFLSGMATMPVGD